MQTPSSAIVIRRPRIPSMSFHSTKACEPASATTIATNPRTTHSSGLGDHFGNRIGGELATRVFSEESKSPMLERRLGAAAFAASGAAALILEVCLQRQLARLLGVSGWSTAIVLATYMAGLMLGAALL